VFTTSRDYIYIIYLVLYLARIHTLYDIFVSHIYYSQNFHCTIYM